MRSILLAAVLAASTLVTHVKPADACGGPYEWRPTAHLVATPRVAGAQSFALLWDRLDAVRAATVKLARLDPTSFDTTSTAFGRTLERATKLTLIGPSGTRLIDATKTMWVDFAFDQEEAREAVVVPKGDFVIALDGHFKDATWETLDVMNGSTVTSFRARDVQITLGHGTDRFTVGQLELEGYPLGVVTVRGGRYLAVRGAKARNDVWLAKI